MQKEKASAKANIKRSKHIDISPVYLLGRSDHPHLTLTIAAHADDPNSQPRTPRMRFTAYF